MIKIAINLTLLLILISSEISPAQAQKLAIKSNLLGQRQYSTDNIKYHNFGMSWEHFIDLFENDETGLSYIRSARDYNLVSILFVIPTGISLGYFIAQQVKGKTYKPEYQIIGLFGIGGTVVFKGLTNKELNKAVNRYNLNLPKHTPLSKTDRFISLVIKPAWVGIQYNF